MKEAHVAKAKQQSRVAISRIAPSGVRRRNNRHSKRYEEEARRAERAFIKQVKDGDEDEKGAIEEKEDAVKWDGRLGADNDEVRLEDLVKVTVVKSRRRRELSSHFELKQPEIDCPIESNFEFLDPVRNVVVLDEADFVDPGQAARLEFDDSRALDGWEEINTSDFELSDDDLSEEDEDIDVWREKRTYAGVLAS